MLKCLKRNNYNVETKKKRFKMKKKNERERGRENKVRTENYERRIKDEMKKKSALKID